VPDPLPSSPFARPSRCFGGQAGAGLVVKSGIAPRTLSRTLGYWLFLLYQLVLRTCFLSYSRCDISTPPISPVFQGG